MGCAATLVLAGCSGEDGTFAPTTPASTPSSSTSASPGTSTSVPSPAPPSSPADDGGEAATVTVEAPDPPSGGPLRPAPDAALQDRPAAYVEGCQQTSGTEVIRCEDGDADGDRTVALVGDSKALQWASTLDVIGRQRGWRVVTMTRSGCPWTDAVTSRGGAPDTACRTWGGRVTDALVELQPDLVVTSAVRGSGAPPGGVARPSEQALVDGYVRVWDEVADAGVPVAALSDTPQPGDLDVPECVAAHRDDLDACTLPPGEGSGTPALRAASRRAGSATFVDLTGVLCPGGTCRPTYGDVLVYRNGSHVTDTLARLLAPSLSPVLAGLLPRR